MNFKEVQEIRFSKAVSGYKADEVDTFCDNVIEDYKKFAEILKSKEEKIEKLEKKIAENESSADSINTVLISAQKLADSIVADAKAKSQEIIENAENEAELIKQRTKKALEEIDAVITEQKNKAADEAEIMLGDAVKKSEGMIVAAKDSVAREQLLFNKLRAEVAAFKVEIKNAYKAHLESLSALPDEVAMNPEQAAIAIEEIINNEPNLRAFIDKQGDEEIIKTEAEENTVESEEPQNELPTPLKEVMNDMAAGFIIKPIEEE